MGERLAGFLIDAVDHLNVVESALLEADGDMARTPAHERLGLLRKAAARLGLVRTERLAGVAAALSSTDGKPSPLLLRALARLRKTLETLGQTSREPEGDDRDLIAASEKSPLSDTLARARDRLLEISPAERDPRLAALIARLAALGAELERIELDDSSDKGPGAQDTAA
jgi:hypothetical protein